jgi:hypothetical protein
MNQEQITIPERDSSQAKVGSIIISVRNLSARGCDLSVGFPGMRNAAATLDIGDAILYETLEGILEVRLLGFNTVQARFLVTHVAPRPGIRAGAIEGDPYNGPFTESELTRVATSIEKIKIELSNQRGLLSEQSKLLNHKLDEIADAAHRMGRKDWLLYALGSLTSLVYGAAFAPEVATRIFATMNSEFGWLFAGGMLLLEKF